MDVYVLFSELFIIHINLFVPREYIENFDPSWPISNDLLVIIKLGKPTKEKQVLNRCLNYFFHLSYFGVWSNESVKIL